MGQIQSPAINWLDEAWRLSKVLADMPAMPPGRFTGPGLLTSKWKPLPPRQRKLDPHKKQRIELLQDIIDVHLTYRVSVVHGVKPRLPDGTRALVSFANRNPASVMFTYAGLVSDGVKFTDADRCAIDAHMKLGRTLIDCYVCDEWKRLLPLIVASISGSSVSHAATLKARQPRKRLNDKNQELRDAKARRMQIEPEESWKESLTQLQGDGLVTGWDDKLIRWRTADNDERTTATSTFRTWKKLTFLG